MQTSETEQEIASRDRVRRPVRTWLAGLANAVAVLRRVPAVVAACAFLLLAGMQTSAAAPVINSLNPASGSTAGDTYVTINGADFGTQPGDVISVTFGGVAGQSPELLTIVEAGTQIGVRTPAHPAGTVDVVVTVTGGVATKTGAFTFVDPPVLSGVAPAVGSPAGGATLTIQGNNLATAFSVEFGTCTVDALFGPQCDPSTTAAIVSQTDTEIVVTAPALAEGTYDLLVSTDYGKTILADAYTATSATAVSNVTISASPLIAGQATTIQATFTSTTALAAGDTITVKLTGYSFPVGATTVITGAGFVAGTSLSGTVAGGATDTVVVTVGAGGTDAGSFGTLGIPAINPAAGTLARSGLTVATSKDTRPTASNADIVIAAAPITGVAFIPSSFTAGADISLRVDFTDPLALATGDTITLGYTGFVVPTSGLVAARNTGFLAGTTFAVDATTAGTIRLTVTGSAPAGSANSLTLSGTGLKNPATAGTIAKAGLTVGTTATPTPAAAGADVVITAPPPRLAFITQPAGCVINAPCTTQPRVAVQDAGGNQINSSASIVLTKKSGPGALSCASNPVSAVSGVATFSGCRFDEPGDYVLTASTTGGVTSGDSAAFTVQETPILTLDSRSRSQFLEDDKCCTASTYWGIVDFFRQSPDLLLRVTPPPGVSPVLVKVAFTSSSPSGVVSSATDATLFNLSNFESSSIRGFYVLTVPNASGEATLRFSATINGQEVGTLDVPITVAPVNDAPSATFKDGGTHFLLAEGQTALTVPGFVASTSPGPADEAGQSVSLSTDVDSSAFTETGCAPPPSISPDGTITFPSIPNTDSAIFGGCRYSLIVQDDGDNQVACSFFDDGIGNSNRGCRVYRFSYAFPRPKVFSTSIEPIPVINLIASPVRSTAKTSSTPDVTLGFDVTNRGNFRVQGVRVQMAPPNGVASATWTCLTPQGGACTPASGSGAIDVLLDLDVAETAEVRLSGTYSGATFFTFQPILTRPGDLPPDTVIVEPETPTRFVIPASSAGVFLGDFEGN